jgi:DNA-3-methyladenine glycosylase II
MPMLTTNTPEVAYLMERDWRLRHLIEAVGDLSYEVSGFAYEHVAHSVIEQMLSMRAGRTIEGRLRGLCGGAITGEAVLSLSPEEIRSCGVAALTAVRGIGRWTVDMFLIFYLNRPDVLPVEGGAVRQVFS